MKSLFGIPMDTVMAWMLAIFIVVTLVVVILALFNPLFFKMGLRNIPRRRAQTILIIVGLMLSTVIVTSAFGTGDTLSYSIRSSVVSGMGYVDEAVFHVSGYPSADQVNGVGPFSSAVARSIQANVAANPSAAASVPALISAAPLQDLTTGQTKAAGQIAAFPAAYPAKFGPLTTTDGSVVTLGQLAANEVYINAKAADDLGAHSGDLVVVYFRGRLLKFHVRAALKDENLASGALSSGGGQYLPSLLLPLDRLAGMAPNTILVSNKGDATSGADKTDDVTDPLRALLAKPGEVAAVQSMLVSTAGKTQLKKLIDDPANAGSKSKLVALQQEVARVGQSDRLKSLLSNPSVVGALKSIKDPGISRPLNDDLAAISDYSVQNVKQDGLTAADLIGSVFVSIFIVFGLFSIAAGIMLIFLIFVMLAAERREEMGMARAVGTKRRHLIQQFLFEGYVYNLAAALVGIVLGVLVGLGMVRIMAYLLGSYDFTLIGHIEPRSLVVAFCLGALVTFLTVVVSSYRVSRLNIVAAIRDLPEDFGTNRTVGDAWRRSLKRLPRRPSQMVIRSLLTAIVLLITVSMAARGSIVAAALLLLLLAGTYFWPLVVAFMARGPVLAVAGVVLIVIGFNTNQYSWFGIGTSLTLIGIAMLIRWGLRLSALRDALGDRVGYTLAGLLLMIFWLLPFDFLTSLGLPNFDGGIEMFFISGILLVMGGVWTVMFNADLIATGLQRLFSWNGSLAPVMKMAVTYPMQQKFRTGLTLAMFALVIFTLMVMSVLTRSASGSLVLNRDDGGYQIYGAVSVQNTGTNNAAVIAANRSLSKAVAASGGIGVVSVGVRQPGQQDQSWSAYLANVLDDAYLSSTRFTLHDRAAGFISDAAVWQKLRTQPGYAVVDASLTESSGGFGNTFTIKGLKYKDTTFSPQTIEIRDNRSGTTTRLQVIGVLDANASNLGDFTSGIYTGERSFISAGLAYVQPTEYVYRTAAGADVHATALLLGKTFLREGFDVKEAQKEFNTNQAFGIGIDNLLEGFMALGLIVGIAALGVIAFRSVVERRQQIGMMRAIGFRKGMVRTSFLIESSFVAILGTFLGVVLGLWLARNLVASIAKDNSSVVFVVPWLQIVVIIVVAYVASLITTFVPAWQASRVYPAEALRYE